MLLVNKYILLTDNKNNKLNIIIIIIKKEQII